MCFLSNDIFPDINFAVQEMRLEKRLAKGQEINSLDHDIVFAYSHSNNLVERHAADNILAEKARKRITVSEIHFSEREP